MNNTDQKNILWLVDTFLHLGKIEQVQIEKETEKTYTIRTLNGTSHRVNKSDMKIYSGVLFKTKPEAIEGLKDYLKKAILAQDRAIEVANKRKEAYNMLFSRTADLSPTAENEAIELSHREAFEHHL